MGEVSRDDRISVGRWTSGVLVILVLFLSGRARASICDEPGADWLMCEDFEGADAGWASWFDDSAFVECLGCTEGHNDPDRIVLSDAPEHVFDGRFGLHMPAGSGSDHQGAELIFRTCEGEGRPGCGLANHEQLYLRAQVRLADDHEYVHHFLSLGGTRPGAYWEGGGNAGCRPDGLRYLRTTVEFNDENGLYFYSYFPEMRCDAGGYCSGSFVERICNGCAERGMPCASGPECCWGNVFTPPSRRPMPRGEWVCIEMMMQANTPGVADGRMAFWLDDELIHEETAMRWREVPELGLNQANLSHYIARSDADRPNRISFDDFVVSTSRIGCTMTPNPGPRDAGVFFDAGGLDAGPSSEVDGGRDGGIEDTGVPHDGGASPDAGPPSGGGCSVSSGDEPVWLLLILAACWRRRWRVQSETGGGA